MTVPSGTWDMRFHAVQAPDGRWATVPVTKLDTCTDADHPHPTLTLREDSPPRPPKPTGVPSAPADPQMDLFDTPGES